MIDTIYFIVLVLNASGLFRFIAPWFDMTIGQVSLILLVINTAYLVIKIRYPIALFRHPAMRGWLYILLIWPLVTLLYAPSLGIREVGLQFYYFVLFLGAAVYTLSNGLPAARRILAVSLLITIIGIPLSMMAPEYFEKVAALAEARVEEMGRPLGFFMQPNRLATSLVMLFIGWFALSKNKNAWFTVLAILCFLGCNS